MSTWGSLNPALTAWRNGINRRLPGRGTTSDGAMADSAHSSTSQHQQDSDGTVDAFDMDVNVLGSDEPGGTEDELAVVAAMKLDFEDGNRGHLWIHAREIAQHDHGWDELYYGGSSDHFEHVHWESRPDHEKDGSDWPMPHTDRLLEEMGIMAVSGFTTEAKAQLETEATQGVLSYKGGGLPSWEGQPASRNFLNTMTQLFWNVEALQKQVTDLTAKIDAMAGGE